MALAESIQILLADSGLQTTSGSSAVIDLGARDRLLRQSLAVTVASGTTPALDVRLEACSDAEGLAGWRAFGSFARATATKTERLTFIAPERYVRVSWTIAGTTPSFRFAISGTRDIVYANLEDFEEHGLPAAAAKTRTPSQTCAALAAASETASGKLAARYDLPIVAWGTDLTQAICKIAGYDMLSVRGFNPDGDDANVRTRYEDASSWLDDVVAGEINPVGLVDSTPDVEDDGAIVLSNPARGWSR